MTGREVNHLSWKTSRRVPMFRHVKDIMRREHLECTWHRAGYFHAGLLSSTSFCCMGKLLGFAFMVSIRNDVYTSGFPVMSNHTMSFRRLCGPRTVAFTKQQTYQTNAVKRFCANSALSHHIASSLWSPVKSLHNNLCTL